LELAVRIASEATIVKRACRGDRRAFAALHQRYARVVHAILLARLPAGEVEDCLQDVFVLALRKIHTLRDAGSVGPWLATLARNRAADWWRREIRPEPLPEEVVAPHGREVEAGEVLDIVRGLPAAYAETLMMRLAESMTGPEIARATGLSPGSVRVNLHRGMKLLRERLGWDESEGDS
jgi:RNA polymerase sigma-70 factor (ECF subfamily)